MILEIYRDDTYLIKKYTHDDLFILGELFRNCLNEANYEHVREEGRNGIYGIFKKQPGKTKYKRWVCASFIHDEILGFGNRKLSLEEFLEVWKLYERNIAPNDKEYSVLYRICSWFYNADENDIEDHLEHFDELTTDDISAMLGTGDFQEYYPDDEDNE